MLLSNSQKNQRYIILSLILIAFLTALFSLSCGTYTLPFSKLLAILFNPIINSSDHFTTTEYHIVWNIRLPRILIAFSAGATLALSGSALQGIFQNPLVDPHIVGVTSGAAFGGSLAILLGLSTYGLITATFTAGLLTLFLVYLITNLIGKENRIALVLVGIILSGFLNALVSLIQYLADTEEILPNIIFWLLGSFSTANWSKLFIFVIPSIIGCYLLLRLRWYINLLSLGDTQAKMLGISLKKVRWIVLFLCALIVSAQVSVSGSIGWVGLIIPHLSRFIVGSDHRKQIPCALILGGIFMILVDTLARTITSAEVPIGIITALLGAPIFTLLLLHVYRHRHEINSQ